MAPGVVAGGLLAGAAVFALVKGQALALAFALFVGFSATQMLRDRKPAPAVHNISADLDPDGVPSVRYRLAAQPP